jgi:hypothetical protein
VALIVGITGACRKHELSQLKINEIEDLRSAALSALVKILDTEKNFIKFLKNMRRLDHHIQLASKKTGNEI